MSADKARWNRRWLGYHEKCPSHRSWETVLVNDAQSAPNTLLCTLLLLVCFYHHTRVSDTDGWTPSPGEGILLELTSVTSTGKLSNFRPSDVETTRHTTRVFRSMDLTDGRVGGRGRNSLDALLKPECPLHLIPFNVCSLNRIGQQTALNNSWNVK